MIARMGFWLGLALIVGTVGWQTWSKQAILDHGREMLLPLAPVDPRSLMQGDYMDLRYADILPEDIDEDTLPRRGVLVVTLTDAGEARARRLHQGESLAAGEYLLAYHTSHGRLAFAAESFLFQEGTADKYEDATHGLLKVAEDGTALLSGLR
ncbi:GDYXXLXY domain-containing protein [Novispirillum sp. DQ9]|uniref:GDYXXLXY domain-containing protein n=1 Tax=Novispirillum sp. DQ9 TaxID=3398612 RepID=UPI003C7E475D